MNDKFLESNFGEDTSVNREIQVFIQTLATSKTLRFNLADFNIKFPEMASSGMITKAKYFPPGLEGTYTNDPRIIYGFYKHFSSIFGYTLTADGAAIQKFAHQVGDYFHVQAPLGVSELVNSLTLFLIDNARLGYGLNLTTYALTLQLPTEQERFFEFFNVYFEIIFLTNDSFESVWNVCEHFALQIGLPKGYDMVWRKFSQFIHLWVDHHNGLLTQIRTIAEKEQTEPALKVLYLELLLKICEKGTLKVEELVDWLVQEYTRERALQLLSIQTVVDPQLRGQLLDKLITLPIALEQKIQRLQVYLKMLEDSVADDPTFKAELINEINSHFHDTEIADMSTSLRLLGGCKAEPEARYGILEKFLQKEQFKPEYLANGMETFFIFHKNIKLFFRFIRIACLQTLSTKDVQKAMEGAIYQHRNEDMQAFEQEAILLCIDSEGPCRWLGQDLLFSEFALEQQASLSYDITQLDVLQQYKLVISLLTPFRPINHTIPIVIRLLDSASEIVQELIACKIEELIPAYQYNVIEQVEALLPDTHPQKTALLARLETVWADLADILTKKRAIKELDPLLAETEQIRAYNRAKTGVSRQITKKARKEHRGLSNMVKHTQVARGGGTVMRDGTVTPMMTHNFSFTLPRTIFITPERNDYEMQRLLSTNWDKDFEECQQIILSSGSI